MPHYRGKSPKLPVSEPELEDILAFVAKTRVSYREAWMEELRSGTMEAFVAVLLCQPSHLTQLFLGPDFVKESNVIGLLLRSALCDKGSDGLELDFGDLKSVSFERYPNYQTYKVHRNTADVLPLFYLPSVTHISAAIENPIIPTTPQQSMTLPWPAACAPSCPSLHWLKLTAIREPFLGQLLSVTDQVRSLEWEWYYNPMFRDQVHTPTIDLNQFMTGISRLRHSLEELVISANCDYGGDIELPSLDIRGSFEPLADFDKLKNFTAPLALLVGFSADETKQLHDSLPLSLEFLTITDDLCLHDQYEWEDRDALSVIESWLDNFHESTPNLREIALFLRLADDTWNQPIRDEFQDLCDRVGVKLKIIKLHDDMF